MPTYEWRCDECKAVFDVVCAIDARNLPRVCDCGSQHTERLLTPPAVMNHALPDGTKRFDGVRRSIDAEKEKREKQREERKRLVDLATQKEAG